MPCTFISYKKPPSSGSNDPMPRLQIGSGTSILERQPLYGLYDYSQGGMIYLAEELFAEGANAGGAITQIGFEFRSWTSGYRRENQTIKISHVLQDTMPERGYPDYRGLNIFNTTSVKTFDFVAANGWQLFDLTTPFIWNGIDNILISWENHDGDWKGGYGWLRGEAFLGGERANRSNIWYVDNAYPTAPAANVKGRPNLIINANAEPPR